MATLGKLYLFIHTKSFIMLLSIVFFTFIFPFEAQQCCAWIVLGTSSMSYLTLLRLLDVCRWISVFILFLAINMCCVKGWKIFARKEDGFIASIMFISCIVYFKLHCSILFRCLLVLYLFDSHLLFGFLLFFVSINTYLQESTCIMFISRIVWFALSCCLLLSSFFSTWSLPSLLFGFPSFWLFFFKWQQSTWNDLMVCTMNYTRSVF